MSDCPFCAPNADRIFHESELVLGVWDAYPVSPGHALLVTRRHVATWFDATRDEQTALLDGITRAREEIERRHRPDGYNVGVNVNAVAGQTVFHLHVHVIPRYRGDVANPRGGVRHVIPRKADYPGAEVAGAETAWSSGHTRPLVRGGLDPLLPHLLADLDRAIGLDVAVAFVVRSGVDSIDEHLRDLLVRGGRVRFLTGDYLDVTEPEALSGLLDLNGALDLRVFEARTTSFHPKAFILHFPDGAGTAYVGSSNLTRTALASGVEWNYRVVTSSDRAGFSDVCDAFEELFQDPATRSVDDSWIQSYRARRRPASVAEVLSPVELAEPPPRPNEVQREALEALSRTRNEGNTAGLVVLATGLGKTWLSAFDSDRPEFRRVLFVAHREEILGQAIKTFRCVRPTATIGRYDGSNRQADADVLFASVLTLGRLPHLNRFERDRFDYIVVDEFHHAAARTYRNLIRHFRPKFLLGLTATPERTDGGDLLALCQENLVYRCDVFDGIDRELLSPFRYFGVPDEVDYSNIPWRSSRFDEEALTAAVATEARARNAFEQHRKLAQRRTLSFCCSQRHADFMADYFRRHGLRAVAVHSGPGSAPRAASLEQLENGALDVVFAVDMFNEGVDIPSIDTVLMLRPTESAILWQQQFGRGLRKAAGKSHLCVIDYIGNHRVFLNKVRALFQAGAGDAAIDRILNLQVQGEARLPLGCEVTYDLRSIEILKALLRPASSEDALKAYYVDFKERHGARPTAVEAHHDRYLPRATRVRHGSWLGFVREMGDLSDVQLAAWQEHEQFLRTLETTQMTRSFKMLTLLAMLDEDRFPGRIEIETLMSGFRARAERSAVLQEDVGVDLTDGARLRRYLEENPIAAWTGGKGTGGRPYFAYREGVFETAFAVQPEQREALCELVREIADWRLAQYLDRPRSEAGEEAGMQQFTATVSHAEGRPILFLPDRKQHPGLPRRWTKVLTSEGEFEANFVMVAINVMRRPGSSANELPDVLRKWFGPNAGKPGTRYYVLIERKGNQWRMRPQSPREEAA
jgi:superfamily II DNA or RNA helicase/diadenosine tetraphosphate (Ap4A) HIT family hydrolase